MQPGNPTGLITKSNFPHYSALRLLHSSLPRSFRVMQDKEMYKGIQAVSKVAEKVGEGRGRAHPGDGGTASSTEMV